MIYRYSFPVLLSAALLNSTSVLALTCRNDYAGVNGCAANASAIGDCVTLGYSKNDVTNCGHYIICPFDSNYKTCIKGDCSNYKLSACPENGVCAPCTNGVTTKYALVGCQSGYVVNYAGTCSKTYKDCGAAGYVTDTANKTCAKEDFIYLIDATPTKCYNECTCVKGYVDVSGSCKKTYKTCEDAGYYPIGTDATCTSTTDIYTSDSDASKTVTCCTQTPTCEGPNHVLDGQGNCVCASGYVDVGGVCEKTWASCDAYSTGWVSSVPANSTCSSQETIYLTDGSQVTCYGSCTCDSGYTDINGVCTKVYASCNDYSTGWVSSVPANSTCSSQETIYLTNGSQVTCYGSCTCDSGYIEVNGVCHKTYSSCEEAGYISDGNTQDCSAVTIYLTNGSKKTCYASCSSIDYEGLNACLDNCSTLWGAGCNTGDIDACSSYNSCRSTCYLHYTSNDLLPPSSMLAVESISEKQCKIKYTNTLYNHTDDDCQVYNV